MLRLDSLGTIVKVELLRNLVPLLPLEDEVSSSSNFNGSSTTHSGDNVEWSSNMESKVFVKSFTLNCGLLITVDNLPLLVLTMYFVSNYNLSTFFIFLSLDLDHFTLDVKEHILGESEDLEPFTCCGPHVDVASCSRVLNTHGFLGANIHDSSAVVVELPLLSL